MFHLRFAAFIHIDWIRESWLRCCRDFPPSPFPWGGYFVINLKWLMREQDRDNFFWERLSRNCCALKEGWGCFGWTVSLSFCWAMASVGLASSAQGLQLGRVCRARFFICRIWAPQMHQYPKVGCAALAVRQKGLIYGIPGNRPGEGGRVRCKEQLPASPAHIWLSFMVLKCLWCIKPAGQGSLCSPCPQCCALTGGNTLPVRDAGASPSLVL